MSNDDKITVKFETTREKLIVLMELSGKCPGNLTFDDPTMLHGCPGHDDDIDACDKCYSAFITRIEVK